MAFLGSLSARGRIFPRRERYCLNCALPLVQGLRRQVASEGVRAFVAKEGTRPAPLCRHGASRGENFHEQRIGVTSHARTHGSLIGLRIDDGRVASATMVVEAADAKAGPQGE